MSHVYDYQHPKLLSLFRKSVKSSQVLIMASLPRTPNKLHLEWQYCSLFYCCLSSIMSDVRG